jgi:hypothetical protein
MNESATEPDTVLSWPAAKFRAALRAALVAASKDEERPHLCAVQIQRVNGSLSIAATDGTWLFRWKEAEGQTDEEGNVINRAAFSCLISRRVLESFIDATKKHLELERVLLTGAGHRWELSTIMDVCRHESLQVPAEFPPLDTVIPTVVAPSVSAIGVGANMMAAVAKAFALATSDNLTTIYWQFSGDALSPLVCTSPSHEELLAIVMPRRTDADANAVPEKAKATE